MDKASDEFLRSGLSLLADMQLEIIERLLFEDGCVKDVCISMNLHFLTSEVRFRLGERFLSDRKESLQKGIRPVVITQSDQLNRNSTSYIGASITSILKKKDVAYHVALPMNEGIPKKNMVLAEQRWTFDRSELKGYRCTLNEQLMTQIKNEYDQIGKAAISYSHLNSFLLTILWNIL